jgi:hypothetical protein
MRPARRGCPDVGKIGSFRRHRARLCCRGRYTIAAGAAWHGPFPAASCRRSALAYCLRRPHDERRIAPPCVAAPQQIIVRRAPLRYAPSSLACSCCSPFGGMRRHLHGRSATLSREPWHRSQSRRAVGTSPGSIMKAAGERAAPGEIGLARHAVSATGPGSTAGPSSATCRSSRMCLGTLDDQHQVHEADGARHPMASAQATASAEPMTQSRRRRRCGSQ